MRNKLNQAMWAVLAIAALLIMSVGCQPEISPDIEARLAAIEAQQAEMATKLAEISALEMAWAAPSTGFDNVEIAGTLDVAGATTLEALSFGSDGSGTDVTFYSSTAGDSMLWDASDEALEITGTSAQDALAIVEGNLTVDLGDLAVTAGAFDVTAGATSLEATTFGVDGTGADVQWFSDTAGDSMLWDASDEALEITGTTAQNALDIVEGNVQVTLGGLDVTAGATTLEALATGVDGTGANVYNYSNTAGDWMFYDPAGPTLNVIGTNAVTALNVSDGNAVVNDDLTVTAGNFAVSTGTATVAGITTLGSDVTLTADATGGNALAKTEYIGLPRIQISGLGTLANGTTNTVIVDIGDSETPATDWTAVDADTVMTNDATYYRQGTASLKMAVDTAADATDGCTNALASGDQDWTDDESVGMWFYADTALTAGDLTLVITDGGAGDTAVDFPAYATPNVWQWIEIDVSGVANASKDVITDLSIELSAAGAAVAVGGAFNVYMDFIVKWDVAEEEALGQAIVQDGVMSVTIVDATTTGATSANLVLYTDYFIHYQTGADSVVMITDQSGADIVGLALIAY